MPWPIVSPTFGIAWSEHARHTMSKRAVIVARVSTEGQGQRGFSITTQLEAMRAYCAAAGLIVAHELQDVISGTKPLRDRPGGAAMIRLIETGEVEAVVFYAVDRVTRDDDVIELATLRRDVKRAGIELHYANEGGKSDLSALGGIIDNVRATLAAEERKKIIERSVRGRRGKAQSGRWVGQGDTPFGYRRAGMGKDSRLEINEREAETIRLIFALYVGADPRGPMPIRTMTEWLTEQNIPTPQRGNFAPIKHNGHAWHTRSIGLILTRPLYAGMMTYADMRVPMPELRIIDDATFEAAQVRKTRNRETARRNRSKGRYLMAGHLRCICGRAMCGRKKAAGRYEYYYCAGVSLPRHLRDCDEPNTRADAIDGQVWAWLADLLTDPDTLAAALERIAARALVDLTPKRDRLGELDKEAGRLERRIWVWVKQYADAGEIELEALRGEVKRAGEQLAAVKTERARVEAEIAQAAITPAQVGDAMTLAAQLRDYIPEADYDAKRYILERLGIRCRLRRTEAGEVLADVTANLPGQVVSTALQSTSHNMTVLLSTSFRVR